MRNTLKLLLHPMLAAGFVTWLAVVLSLRAEPAARQPLLWTLLLVFLAALVAIDVIPERRRARVRTALLAVQAVGALVLVALAPRGGAVPVLLVIITAQLATHYPARVVVPVLVVFNVTLYLLLRAAGHVAPLIVTLLYTGFQAFAALTAHCAQAAERSRDALLRVNADLLATRALLADTTRDAERVRMARELHDVAGHKLTALTLNLRLLAADPALAQRSELTVAQRMAGELMHDIREFAHALRDARGVDLGTALHALAAPLPRPALELALDDDLQVRNPASAEAVLRLVQEALTNAARHADASTLFVAVKRDGDRLRVEVDDDGRLAGPLREGNGMAGMRERVAAAGGTMAVGRSPRGSLRIEASMPL